MTTEEATPPPKPVPKLAAVGGLVVAVSAFLPLHPEGLSFFDLFLIELSRGLLEGLLMLVSFGSPYLFGLTVALAPWLPSTVDARVVRIPVALMHSQLLLVAIVLVSAGEAVAPFALLGFAVVSGGYLALHTARANAEGRAPVDPQAPSTAFVGPAAAWYAQWGAMVIAGIAAWTELQRVGGVALGYGLHVLLGGALMILAVTARRAKR
jgi:hypothetical protein